MGIGQAIYKLIPLQEDRSPGGHSSVFQTQFQETSHRDIQSRNSTGGEKPLLLLQGTTDLELS